MECSTQNSPEKTPLYHALQNKRYNRQDKIRAIESITNRILIVYTSNIHHPLSYINQSDVAPIVDLLQACDPCKDLDLFIHSSGGDIDIAEKIVYMLRNKSKSFRVIVPEYAKSAATLIALASDSIAMSYTSELGPIDPQITITTADGKPVNRPAQSFLDGLDRIKEEAKNGLSPAYYPLLNQLDPALIDYCHKTKKRAEQFASKWLNKYMCKDDSGKADKIAKELVNVNKYLSHGTVIDSKEAITLGLTVEELDSSSELWKKIWDLHSQYLVDMSTDRLVKVFESSKVSIAF